MKRQQCKPIHMNGTREVWAPEKITQNMHYLGDWRAGVPGAAGRAYVQHPRLRSSTECRYINHHWIRKFIKHQSQQQSIAWQPVTDGLTACFRDGLTACKKNRYYVKMHDSLFSSWPDSQASVGMTALVKGGVGTKVKELKKMKGKIDKQKNSKFQFWLQEQTTW